MALPPPITKPLAPKPLPPAPIIGAASGKKFTSAAPVSRTNHRICLYGTGGIGKTTLAAHAPGPVKVLDLDESLSVVAPLSTGVETVNGIEKWQDLRDALHQTDLWVGVKTVVVDTLSRAEEMASRHVLDTVKADGGKVAERIEDYGYGKGYNHVHTTFLNLFSDLDSHIREGRNVVLICHDATTKIPNPSGEDYIRWEPRLQNSGSANTRAKLKEWCDHMFFLSYDISVRNKKVVGAGSRMIYPVEQAHFMAKSRTLAQPIQFTEAGDSSLWEALALPF